MARRFLTIGIPLTDAEPGVSAYAKPRSQLQATSFYKGVGRNDLWIAAASMAFDRPLVTRNPGHFEKIEGLRLEGLV